MERGRLWRKPLGLNWFMSAAAKDVSGECEFEHNSCPDFTLSDLVDYNDRYKG